MTTPQSEGAADQRMAILADHAGRAVTRQATRVDELRARASALFGAASIAGAFLGAEAFKGEDGPGAWAWVGAALFVVSGCMFAYVLWPRTWAFTIDIRAALAQLHDESMSVDQTNETLAFGLWEFYERNERRLKEITMALAAMVFVVVGEMVALFINLALG